MGLQFIVKEVLVERAMRAINRYYPQLEEQDIWDLLDEVQHISDGVSIRPDGSGLSLELSDVQIVAFAAALAAAGEVLTMADQ